MRIAGARASLHAEEPCGDAYAWWADGPIWTICMVDGLGHGPDAARAAQMALSQAEASRLLKPQAIIAAVDGAIRNTRGVAMSVARIDAATSTLTFAGVGNVRMALIGGGVARFEARPGIVGTGCRAPSTESASWGEGDLIVLWTDGFPAYLELDLSHRSRASEPQSLADELLAGASTGRDDAAILCCGVRAMSA